MAALAQRIPELATPQDHFRALITNQKHDHLLWAKGRKEKEGKEWFKLSPEWALDQLAQYTNEPEVFITPNEFYGWRYIRLLAALNAFYVDIDVHEGQGCPVQAAWTAIGKIESARLPSPNMVVYTGRGAHLYWLFERTPKQALPRWQLVQKVLVQLTSGDTQVMDATRVLRLVGTTNSQADRSRRTVRAELLNPVRYQFDWLCDQIVQIPRAEIRDLQAARARKEARQPSEKQAARQKANVGSIYQVWYLRYQDLIKITDAYWFGGVPPGHRNQMLLHMSVALSWFTKSEALKDEITHVARHHMPSFTESEITSTVSSVLKRALHAAEGKKYEWNGMQVDPRYRFKAETLWDVFGELVMDKPELIPELRAIIPPEERAKREADLQAQRDRVQEGRYKAKRSEYLQEAGNRKEQALRLSQDGLTNREIADKLGVTTRTIHLYLKDATPTPSPAAAQDVSKPLSQAEKCAQLVYATLEPLPAQEPVRDDAQKVAELKAKGHTVRQIADLTGISKSRVDRLLKSYPQATAVPEVKSAPSLYVGEARHEVTPHLEGRSPSVS